MVRSTKLVEVEGVGGGKLKIVYEGAHGEFPVKVNNGTPFTLYDMVSGFLKFGLEIGNIVLKYVPAATKTVIDPIWAPVASDVISVRVPPLYQVTLPPVSTAELQDGNIRFRYAPVAIDVAELGPAAANDANTNTKLTVNRAKRGKRKFMMGTP